MPWPNSELKQYLMDAASGATFRTLRASAAHTGRRPACPQGLEEAGWYAERGLCLRRGWSVVGEALAAGTEAYMLHGFAR